MNELIISWPEQQRQLVSSELRKLYLLQGKPAVDSQIQEMLEELCSRGIPAQAVMLGIRKLKDEDLKVIKLHTLMEASRGFIHHEERKKSDCLYCLGSGSIAMKTDLGGYAYRSSFSCICEAGENSKKIDGTITWNGQLKQGFTRKGKYQEYELFFPDILGATRAVA